LNLVAARSGAAPAAALGVPGTNSKYDFVSTTVTRRFPRKSRAICDPANPPPRITVRLALARRFSPRRRAAAAAAAATSASASATPPGDMDVAVADADALARSTTTATRSPNARTGARARAAVDFWARAAVEDVDRRARRERRPRETRVERQVRDERARTLGALGNVARMRRARETGGERWRVRAGGNG